MTFSHFNDLPADIRERAAKVKLTIFDVDGVLTDGKLHYSEDGRELKSFHVHDGFGLKRLIDNGIKVAIITARISHLVSQRTAELGIAHVYQGQDNKLACFEHLIHALKLEPSQCCYCGDDLPDLAVMRRVGLSIAVANAHPWIREKSHWRTRHDGGNGAVREVCDLLLMAQGKARDEIDRFS